MSAVAERVDTPPVEVVDTARRRLRPEPDAMPRDARPSRARRERLPEAWRIAGRVTGRRQAATA